MVYFATYSVAGTKVSPSSCIDMRVNNKVSTK